MNSRMRNLELLQNEILQKYCSYSGCLTRIIKSLNNYTISPGSFAEMLHFNFT